MRNAKQFRAMSRYVLMRRYWWAVLAALIFMALSGTPTFFSYGFDAEDFRHLSEKLGYLCARYISLAGISVACFSLVVSVAFLFVGAAMEIGYDRYHLSQYRAAAAPSISELFTGFSIFWRAVGLKLLILLKVFLWSLLLVVPGIIAAYRYALAPFLLAEDPTLTVSEAIAKSKALMHGHKARLFRLHLSFIGWFLLAGLTAGIGYVLLEPYVKTAVTGFYLERTEQLPLPNEAPRTEPSAPVITAPEDMNGRPEMI